MVIFQLFSKNGIFIVNGKYFIIMARKYTNKEFLELLNSVRDDVEILEEYCGMDKRTLFKCKKCGYEWYLTPNHIINSKRTCPNCTGTIKTNERFVKEMNRISPNIELLEKYEKNSKKVLCHCKKCGYEWRATPNNLLSKHSGCPMCAIKKVNLGNKLTTEEFFQQAQGKKNPNIEIKEDVYFGHNVKMRVACKKCGHEWLMTPSNILHGNGCPKCRLSKLEIGLKDFLKEKNIEFEWQIKNDYFEWLNRQSLDFYLPQYNIVIECQGEQHFKPIKHFGGVNRFVDTIERDKKKKDLITENNLIIFYMVEKRFKKYIDSNIILKEIYSDANILWVQTDHYGNLKNNKCLYCFWKDNK